MHQNIDFRKKGGKVGQLMKASEAVSVEIADLQSGKEKWLKKLKVLEAMVCSSLVNLDKWSVENSYKLLKIDASGLHNSLASRLEECTEDTDKSWTIDALEDENKSPSSHASGYNVVEGNYVVDEGISSSSSSSIYVTLSVWHLSLSDLVSIFEGNKLIEEEYAFPDESNQEENMWFSSLYKDDIQYAELLCSIENIDHQEKMLNKGKMVHELIGNDKNISSDDQERMKVLILEEENDCLRKELEQTAKQASILEKEKTEVVIALSSANQRICDLENQKICFESAVAEEYRLAMERTIKEYNLALRKKNEDNETRLSECKNLIFELSQKVCGTEIKDLENKLINSKNSLEETQKKYNLELDRVKSVLEMETSNYMNVLKKAEEENLNLKTEKDALERDYLGCNLMLDEAQKHINLLEKERASLALQISEYRKMSEKTRQDFIMLEKQKDEVESRLNISRNKLDTMLKENFNIESEKRAMEEAYKALIVDFEQREKHVVMLEKEVLSIKEELAHNKNELSEENLAKKVILEEMGKKEKNIKELEKELNVVKIEQECLMKMLESEKMEKKQVIQKLHDEMGRRRALEVSLELAKHEQRDLLVEVENEKIAKNAAFEELESMKDHIGNLENEIARLKAESDENETMLQDLMYEEQSKRKHLDEAISQVLYDDELDDAQIMYCEGSRPMNDSLLTIKLKEHNLKILETDREITIELEQDCGNQPNHLATTVVCSNEGGIKHVKGNKAIRNQALFDSHQTFVSLLVELQALRRAMLEKVVVEEENKKTSQVSMPGAMVAVLGFTSSKHK